MRTRLVLVLIAVAALVLFGVLVRQLSLVSLGLSANAETQEVLRRTLADQRALARFDPQNTAAYRRRFDETRILLRRLEILALTRENLTRQFERILVGLVVTIVATLVAAYVIERKSREKRLARLSDALHALSLGDAAIIVGDHGRDVIGRISSMIEETSRAIGRERKRVQYLEHLSSWQEAARRHAHEMRTPLTAARMEVARLVDTAVSHAPSADAALREVEGSIADELEQLRQFTANFVQFAAVGSPDLQPRDLTEIVTEFCTTFGPTWSNLTLHFARSGEPFVARVDRDLLRQVLVNLCTNSSLALGEKRGTVTFSLEKSNAVVVLDVADDGPGIPPEVRRRLFEPYTTTRKIGEGMGLGLAICKKIMLDHGGDLELLPTTTGATFRLSVPL